MPFKIIRSDITAVQADAIVNTANPEPIFAGGTDTAIYRAAGEVQLLKARQKIGRIAPGKAAATPGFNLNAKYIFHTVGPQYKGGNSKEAEVLASCYRNCLKLAVRYRCCSIAFPLISTGVYGYPKDEALRIAVDVIRDFLIHCDMMVWLVVFDQESFRCSGILFEEIESYIDERTVRKQYDLEYTERERRFFVKEDTAYSDECQEYQSDMIREAGLPEQENKFFTSVRQFRIRKPEKKALARRSSVGKMVRSLDDVLSQVGEIFQERLFRIIDEKGRSDVEVYRRANLDRKLFSKIRCNKDYRPKKATVIALAIALELNLDETKDLLGRAELALSPGSRFDLVIQYFIEHEVYDIYTINMALFEHELPLLGD